MPGARSSVGRLFHARGPWGRCNSSRHVKQSLDQSAWIDGGVWWQMLAVFLEVEWSHAMLAMLHKNVFFKHDPLSNIRLNQVSTSLCPSWYMVGNCINFRSQVKPITALLLTQSTKHNKICNKDKWLAEAKTRPHHLIIITYCVHAIRVIKISWNYTCIKKRYYSTFTHWLRIISLAHYKCHKPQLPLMAYTQLCYNSK